MNSQCFAGRVPAAVHYGVRAGGCKSGPLLTRHRPAGSHGCDRDEQDVEIHLTSHDSGERLQLESLDCNDGIELEDAMTEATCTSVPSKIMCPFSFSCIRKCFARDSRCYN